VFADAPENTVAAFDLAIDGGAHGVELDVRAARGGDLVVFHDPTLVRMAGDARAIAQTSLAELRQLRIAGEPIPSLAEALSWARARRVVVNVELKRDVPDRVALARAAARAFRGYPKMILVSSFDPGILAVMAALVPEIPRALLTHATQRSAPALLAVARRRLVQAVNLELAQATPARVAALRKRGLRIGVWTVNEPQVAEELIARGVDVIISDQPAALRSVISRSRPE
jgi:glycerophosphoryl diester phosphodiesterase